MGIQGRLQRDDVVRLLIFSVYFSGWKKKIINKLKWNEIVNRGERNEEWNERGDRGKINEKWNVN